MAFTKKGRIENMSSKYLIKTLGLALVAALAVSAVAVASASATEFKTSGAFPVAFTATSGEGLLTTKGKNNIKCTSGKGSGEVLGATSVGKVKVIFEGCLGISGLISGTECGNVAKTTIETKEISASPIDIAGSTSGVGLQLKPSTGTVFAEFSCGATKIIVKEEVLGEMKECVNKPATLCELSFTEKAEGEPTFPAPKPLFVEAVGGLFKESAAIVGNADVVSSQAIEQTSP